MTSAAQGSGVSKRGFAGMDPERQREIARKGGASVPREKRIFAQDPQFAVECGKKGGLKSRPKCKAPAATGSVLKGLPVHRYF